MTVRNEQEATQAFNLAAQAYQSCIIEVESLLEQDKKRREDAPADSR